MTPTLIARHRSQGIASIRASSEGKEGVQSFLQKRKPNWLNSLASDATYCATFTGDTHVQKILIANRGEIACRVAATARRMGVKTVAVYSDADAYAKHVAACDEAVHIGGSAPKDSYLRWEKIIEAAKATGAQAVHPGYGFLSENEDFAQACAAAGLVFIGPPASAIQAMGLKAESKQLMEKAGVPLVPGYHGADQDPALLQLKADGIGYPVLIKASAGGGGKGMRAVERSKTFSTRWPLQARSHQQLWQMMRC